MTKTKKGKRIIGMFVFIAMLALGIWVIMLLWNALLPSLFGIAALNYWQAGGIFILCKLLFGRFHPHGHWFFNSKAYKHRPDFYHVHNKMKGMTREERLEFIRQRMAEEHGSEHATE